jgi:hypothetical protein
VGQFYASQQADESTHNGLKRGRDELEYFGVIDKGVEQARHKHTDHANDYNAQGEADHQGHKKRQLGLHLTASALDRSSVLRWLPAVDPKKKESTWSALADKYPIRVPAIMESIVENPDSVETITPTNEVTMMTANKGTR